MYIEDLELDLNLDNSFDSVVQEELGQEVSVDVDIPSSELPDLETIKLWESVGKPPDWQKFMQEYYGEVPQMPGRGKQPDIAPTKFAPNTITPTVVLSNLQDTGDLRALERERLVDEIVNNLTQRLLPRLKKIDKRLKLAAAQAKATDEHNIIMEREIFRTKVVGELKHLAQLLPTNHPVRRRIDSL